MTVLPSPGGYRRWPHSVQATGGSRERRSEATMTEPFKNICESDYACFFQTSLDLLAIANFDGRFLQLNDAWESMLGFSREELMAQPFLEWVHPEDRPGTVAEMQGLAAGKDTLRFENRYRCKDGSYRWLVWSSRPVVERRVVYAVARDVTEQKRAAEQIHRLNADLERRTALLEAANKELEAFSYSVSHDLRAPLRHIDGFADLLQKHARESLDDKSRRYLKVISEAARKMGMLIDDLLVFSRMGRTMMKPALVPLDRLVQEVVREAGSETTGRCIEWDIRTLPTVQADPAMLRQALVNLIFNAVKYTRPSPRARIEIGSLNDHPDEIVVFVRDNGVGFDMQYVDKLFGVFQRLHSDRDFEGTGIGLANVRRVVLRHGGRTWAEGKVDGGATFYFSLPKVPMRADAKDLNSNPQFPTR